MVLAGAAAAADAARGHRFRIRAGVHDVRGDWREVLGLSGRKRSEARFEDSERTRNCSSGVRAKSKEQRAKSKEQRAKSKDKIVGPDAVGPTREEEARIERC